MVLTLSTIQRCATEDDHFRLSLYGTDSNILAVSTMTKVTSFRLTPLYGTDALIYCCATWR